MSISQSCHFFVVGSKLCRGASRALAVLITSALVLVISADHSRSLCMRSSQVNTYEIALIGGTKSGPAGTANRVQHKPRQAGGFRVSVDREGTFLLLLVVYEYRLRVVPPTLEA